MTFFQIPGNIKQQYLPFVLNPNSELNKNVRQSNQLEKKTSPQYFTFRNNNVDVVSGKGKLNVFPSTYEKYMDTDISHLLLYNKNKQSVTYNDIFNSLPGIQIREFLPDTRLDQCINFFGDMITKIMAAFSAGKKQGSDQVVVSSNDINPTQDGSMASFFSDIANNLSNIGQEVMSTLWHAFAYLTGCTHPTNLFAVNGKPRLTDAKNGNSLGIYQTKKVEGWTGPGIFDEKVNTYILSFPYTLYYKLQSCVTTNIYELPCKTSDNMLYSSDGTAGWKGTSEYSVKAAANKIPLVGGILDKIFDNGPIGDLFGNIRINFMPWWNSNDGSHTASPEINIKFILFNDTAEAAMMNFIFVNTIVPNNKWLQYNMFQHSPCLYDIKLEGYNRLFACTGKFDVVGLGILRDPPDEWIDQLTSKYSNFADSKENGKISKTAINEAIKKKKLIKLPDAYEVTMKFQSILPANFNQFLYTYSQNNDHLDNYKDNVYDSSDLATILTQPLADFTGELAAYMESDAYKSEDEGSTLKSYYDPETKSPTQ